MANKALRAAVASAGILLTSLALAACGSVAGSAVPASFPTPGFTGYRWKVVALGHDGKVTALPARLAVSLEFSPGGQFLALNGSNAISGTYQATGDSFRTGLLAMTTNLYPGDDPDSRLAIRAMDSFILIDPATFPVRLTGDRLVVNVGSYTLTCHRAGRQADAPAPSSTG